MLFDIGALAWSAELCDRVRRPRALPARGPPEQWALRHHGPRRRPPGSRCRSAGSRATSRPRCSARRASSRAWRRTPTAPGPSCSSTSAPTLPEPVEGLLTTVAWQVGTDARGLRDGGRDLRHRRGGPVAARRARRSSRTRPRPDRWPSASPTAVAWCSSLRSPASGPPYWDPYARGTILGLTRGIGRAHLARAVVEAMAYQTRDVVDAVTAATGTGLAELRVDGGASVMDLLVPAPGRPARASPCGVPRCRRRPRSVRPTSPASPRESGPAAPRPPTRGPRRRASRRRCRRRSSRPASRRWRRAVERSRGWARDEAGAGRAPVSSRCGRGPPGPGPSPACRPRPGTSSCRCPRTRNR